MNRLTRLALTVFTVMLTPFVYSFVATSTSFLLTTFRLAQWNPGNWIGVLVGVLLAALFVQQLAEVIQLLGLRTPRKKRLWKELLQSLGASVSLASFALGAGGISFILGTLFIPGITFQLAFLLSVLIACLTGIGMIQAKQIPWDRVVRGMKLRDSRSLARSLRGLNTKGLIPWGKLFVRRANETLHYVILGNTGSGKSTWLEVMMSIVLSGVGVDRDLRGMVFDAKRDLIPFLEALGIPYKILNPLDQRCVAWDIGHDIRGEGMAGEFAALLVEELHGGKQKGDNKYFYDAAKLAITAAIVCLQRAMGYEWTFRDLINALETKEVFDHLLHTYHPRPHHFDEFLKGKKTDRDEVLTTVKSLLQQYSVVAARWDAATEKFSWNDWIKGEYLLVFGSDHVYEDAIKKTNTLLFRFGVSYLNNLSPSSTRRIWIFIDEATASGRLIKLETVLALGRSAGVCIAIACQNVSGFINEYGELLFKSIFGLARHKAFFPLDSDSAELISKYIGEYEYVEETYNQSVSYGKDITITYGKATKLGKRPTVLAQKLMDTYLPQPGPENGLPGYFLAPGEGIHYCHYSWDEIQAMRVERIDDFPAYLRVDDEDPTLSLKPWSNAEKQQFGLPLENAGSEPEANNPPRRKPKPTPKPKKSP